MAISTEATKGFFAAMKDQPLVLALIMVCFMLSGLLYYQSHLFNTQRQENVKLFVAMQGEVQKLLSQCLVPAPSNRSSTLLKLPPYAEKP